MMVMEVIDNMILLIRRFFVKINTMTVEKMGNKVKKLNLSQNKFEKIVRKNTEVEKK